MEARTVTNRITQITEDQMIFGNGGMITDLLGNQIKAPNGNVFTGAQIFIAEYAIGKKWSTRFKISHSDGSTSENEIELKVVSREQITVPTGSFDAFKVEGEGWSRNSAYSGSWQLKPKYWIAPGIRRPVAREDYRRHLSGKVSNNERYELTAYVQQ